MKSRVKGDFHARFCGKPEVGFLWLTRLYGSVSGKFMKTVLTIIILLLFVSFSNNQHHLDKFFLGIKLNSNDTYEQLSRDNNFKLISAKEDYAEDNKLEAKYLGKSKTYLNCDSLYIRLQTTLDFGKFDTLGKLDGSKLKAGKELVIIDYINDINKLNAEYSRLLNLMQKEIIRQYPNWTNHKGASSGVFFLTKEIHPMISIGKNSFSKYPHIRVTIEDFGNKTIR